MSRDGHGAAQQWIIEIPATVLQFKKRRNAMKNPILMLCVFIVLAALFLPVILHLVGAIGGIVLGILAALGAALFVVFILVLVLSGAGLLVAGVLGLVAVILLAIALPVLAPLLIVLIPVAILIKLFSR
jgi:hypothetical protein